MSPADARTRQEDVLMKYQAVAVVLMAVWQSFSLGAAPCDISFEPQPGGLIVRALEKPLATYVYEDRVVLRPYFKDVCAPSGAQVTRHHPPREGIDRTDHASMHPGLFLAFGDLSGSDFWRNKGKVEHVEFVKLPYLEEGQGGFVVRNRYVAEGRTICEEVCAYTFMVRPAGFLIVWDSTFRSDRGGFAFGDQEEMGLGVRVATPIVVKVGQGGRILDSEGRRNETEIWGHTAAWCDYGGPVGEGFAGIAVMPHPANFRPCWWHVRDYGFMVANPFGRHAFGKGEPSKVEVELGEPFRLRFGILIHSADSEEDTNLQAAYRDYLSVSQTIGGLGRTKR
jgi:hypothetical protein